MNANTNSASRSAPAGSGADPVTDPNDWEARYQTGDMPWDKGHAAPPLIDFLARRPVRGEVLVPGCGPGHDVRAIASQSCGGASVTGLDVAPTGIALARSHTQVAGERYELGDLFELPEDWNGRFDWVVEHTCFCAIPLARRSDYVASVFRALKPGGLYLGIFYMNPDHPSGPPHGSTPEEIAVLFDPYSELLEEWVPEHAFEGREGRELCQLRRKRS
jgi:methyl halide transferase